MNATEVVTTARTLLFVPGDRPDRFEKAAAAGPDVVVLDLEDAVPADARPDARRHVRSWLSRTSVPTAVRVNAVGTADHEDDLAALADLGPVTVVLAKAEGADGPTRTLARLAEGSSLIALVESAAGVLDARATAATDGVVRLALGHLDLAVDLGLDPEDDEALAPLRSALLLASAAAGLPAPVDGVTPDVHDADRLAADLRRARRTGFGAKLCIHPRQLDAVATAWEPDPDSLAWARRVLAAVAEEGTAVAMVDGAMVDAPVVTRAQRLLAAEPQPHPTPSGEHR